MMTAIENLNFFFAKYYIVFSFCGSGYDDIYSMAIGLIRPPEPPKRALLIENVY